MHGSVRDGLTAHKARMRAAMYSGSFAGFWTAWFSPRPACPVTLDALLGGASEEIKTHSPSCPKCWADLREFQAQSEMLSTLRAPADVEPTPGFYARVLQRIEQRTKKSIWWVFAYSPVGRRLAYVSLTTAIVLGSYVVAQESRDGSLYRGVVPGGAILVAQGAAQGESKINYGKPVTGSADQQREAVLENFASQPGNLQ